jgi:hypothetical protein
MYRPRMRGLEIMDEQKLTKIVIDSYVKGYEDALRNVSKGATEYFDTERVLEIFGDIDLYED